jgi:hypothetical protein
MTAPASRFRIIPQNTAITAVNTGEKRLGVITGESLVSVGAPGSFGSVNKGDGILKSSVLTILFDITDDGGYSVVDTFKLWASTINFVEAASVIKFQPLSGADQSSPSLTENYVANADDTDYTWADLPETVPVAQNIYPSDEDSEMGVSTISDDAIMFALYADVDADEPVAIQNIQFTVGFSYS